VVSGAEVRKKNSRRGKDSSAGEAQKGKENQKMRASGTGDRQKKTQRKKRKKQGAEPKIRQKVTEPPKGWS